MAIKIIMVLLLLTLGDNGTPPITPKVIERPTEPIIRVVQAELIQPTKEYMPVCDTSSFASYMDYRTITNTASQQYKLQQIADTNSKGYRQVGDRVMIAIHSRYGSVGDYLTITFIDGSKVDVIIGDIKAGTDCSHYVNENESSVIEVIVDTTAIAERQLGKIVEYSKIVKTIEKE